MFFKCISATVGSMKYAVTAEASSLGSDIAVTVGGGTQPHIGAVSLAVYEPERDSATVSTVTVHTHRDDSVASYFAKAISREMKCSVTVTAGIHVDNASEEDILLLRRNAADCCCELICKIKALVEE